MAESLELQAARKTRPPAYLEDYVCDLPKVRAQKLPSLPETDGHDSNNDAESVVSHASRRSTRSDLRKKQRDLAFAAQIEMMEIEEGIKRAEAEKKKKIVQLTLEKQMEDIQDEEQELDEEEALMGIRRPEPLVITTQPRVSSIQKIENWFDTTHVQPPSPVPSNPAEDIRAPTPPFSIGHPSQGKSEVTQLGEVIATLGKVVEKMKPSGNPLLSEQVLARKSYGSELPQFNGKPEQWRIFYAAYTQSTEKCGFSNYENIQRLRKCLKGEALAEVEFLLDNPDNVENIMKVLQSRFGKIKHIVSYALSKLQAIPMLKENDLQALIVYGRHVRNLVETLRSTGSASCLNNFQMLQSLVEKLPVSLKIKWTKISLDDMDYSLEKFEKWILQRVETAYEIAPPKYKDEKPGKTTGKCAVLSIDNATTTNMATQSSPQKVLKCQFCQKEGHRVYKCPDFKKETYETRHKLVMDRKLCFSCLNFGHSSKDCRSKRQCSVGGCQYFHHPLLHQEKKPEKKNEKKPTTTQGVQAVQQQLHVSSQITYQILPVTLRGPEKEVTILALLDSGSAYTLIDEKVATDLHLPGKDFPLGFSTISDEEGTMVPSRSVSLSIVNPETKDVYKVNDVHTFPSLNLRGGTVTPSQLKKWPHLNGLSLPLYTDAQPKMLIGLPHHELIIPSEVVKGRKGSPSAGKTPLGWMVYGKMATPLETRNMYNIGGVLHMSQLGSLHDLVKDYFSTEEFGVKPTVVSPLTEAEKSAEELAMKTLKRVGDRFEIGLLWKSEDVKLPESKSMALQRLSSIERKLDGNPDYAKKYCENVQNYIDSGYLVKLSPEHSAKVTDRTWYLPHFGVTKISKPDKLRLVFDAAATSRGTSLNSQLHSGPDILKPLPSVLCKFRERSIAVSADIKEMFHQVRIKDEDQDSQRILWRGMDRQQPPEEYKMQVMTFGATCSPYCAQLVKRENALEFQEQYPRAVESIVNRHYVDDLLDSFDTTEEAVTNFQDIFMIQKHGGFHLCNWTSNEPQFIDKIPQELRAKSQKIFDKDNAISERILGLVWNPLEDCFGFSTNFFKVRKEVLSGAEPPTKREALSLVMSIFDPLGFAAVLTIKAKIILQQVWKCGIGWDDLLPHTLWNHWLSWIAELKQIEEFKIPRCYSPLLSSSEGLELHVFCDASDLAYAAVAYFRLQTGHTSFVAAKTRVTPMKTMTIPRYELQAAVMATRLGTSIKEWHGIPVSTCYFWSDSQIVLCWLSMETFKLKMFVANRVGEILETTNVQNWNWISTKENVADEATRHWKDCDFSSDSRWLNGPAFLRLPHSDWPSHKLTEYDVDTGNLELKKEFCGHLEPAIELPIDLDRFSSWMRLIRTTAYVLRAAKYRFKGTDCCKPLTTDDLKIAEVTWWKWAQKQCYGQITTAFQSGDIKKIADALKHSKLNKLSVFRDENGVLRLKGRVQADVPIGNLVRNPVILESKHQYTTLLIQYHHKLVGHNGRDQVTNLLKERFCIIGLREAVKKVWNNCQTCKNFRAVPIPPEMAPLPQARLESYQRPFTQTGVDYFGPMEVTIGRRHEKRYGALFTCLVTRAVHMELAGSLSTDSFILALRRFIARRGTPLKIYSDNGSNFVGADTELRDALKAFKQDKIQQELCNKSIEWYFIPPYAPHMGGSWERLVKSIKIVLRSTLKEKSPREDTLHTFLLEAEGIVNGHPLTYVDSDVETTEVLTPNHFLIGTPSGAQPPGVFLDRDVILAKQWRFAMRLADHFWTRWVREFLPTLTRRQKWKERADPIKVGDIVLIVEDSLPRNNWPMGIVTETHTSKDGQVRWAMVKTKTGTYKRAAIKLCILDVRKPEKSASNIILYERGRSYGGECSDDAQLDIEN